MPEPRPVSRLSTCAYLTSWSNFCDIRWAASCHGSSKLTSSSISEVNSHASFGKPSLGTLWVFQTRSPLGLAASSVSRSSRPLNEQSTLDGSASFRTSAMAHSVWNWSVEAVRDSPYWMIRFGSVTRATLRSSCKCLPGMLAGLSAASCVCTGLAPSGAGAVPDNRGPPAGCSVRGRAETSSGAAATKHRAATAGAIKKSTSPIGSLGF